MVVLLLLPVLSSARPAPVAPAAAPPAPAAPAAPTLTPAQQAEVQKQDAAMTAAALQAARMVDAGRAADLWKNASSAARRTVDDATFTRQLAQDRARLGALVSRGQPSISRVRYNAGAAVPEGLYLNVAFPARFASSDQPVRELVSFRLDEDQTWRLAGYSVRPPGN